MLEDEEHNSGKLICLATSSNDRTFGLKNDALKIL